MFRWTISFAAVAAMLLATSSDLMAQRRQPLRNLARGFGHGIGSGFHWRTPGPNVDYYSPYSQFNTSSQSIQGSNTWQSTNDAQIIQQIPTTRPTTPNPIQQTTPNSATQLLQQPTFPSQTKWYQPSSNPKWTQPTNETTSNQIIYPTQYPAPNRSIQNDLNINRYLKPYHSTPSTGQTTTNQIQIAPQPTNPNWNINYGGDFSPRK